MSQMGVDKRGSETDPSNLCCQDVKWLLILTIFCIEAANEKIKQHRVNRSITAVASLSFRHHPPTTTLPFSTCKKSLKNNKSINGIY